MATFDKNTFDYLNQFKSKIKGQQGHLRKLALLETLHVSKSCAWGPTVMWCKNAFLEEKCGSNEGIGSQQQSNTIVKQYTNKVTTILQYANKMTSKQ